MNALTILTQGLRANRRHLSPSSGKGLGFTALISSEPLSLLSRAEKLKRRFAVAAYQLHVALGGLPRGLKTV